LQQQYAQVDEEDLLREREQGSNDEVEEVHVAGREYSGGKVSRDSAKADDKHDPETAVASEARQRAVIEVCALKFHGFTAEGVFESEPCADWILH
jgi:hypothetical protein